MSVVDQAERALRASRRKAVKAKLLANFGLFRFEVNHVEKRRGQDDWTNRITAIGPQDQIIGGLWITVKTPGPLDFDRLYSWDLLSFCPLWVEYSRGGESVKWSQNTGRVFKTCDNANP